MSRHARKSWVLLTCWMMMLSGCKPIQPFYFLDDGDLSHMVHTATDIENPDVDHSHLAEVVRAHEPRSLTNAGGEEVWALSLEEAVSTTLANSKVMRSLGANVTDIVNLRATAPRTQLLSNPQSVPTVYDVAIQESGPLGVEQSLAAFDTTFSSSLLLNKNYNPRNNATTGGFASLFTPTFEQQLGTFNAALTKVTPYGTTVSATNRTTYDRNNNPSRLVESDWNTNFGISVTHPLLARGGIEFNRIAGPGGRPGSFNGVVISRIRTDIALADFEAGVRNVVGDVEKAYWTLYFSYRNLDATRKGRDSSLATWSRIDELRRIGARGGDKENWAQAKEQYYLFRGQMEDALTELYKAESRLRYLMGLAHTDDRLIKPADEPTTAKVLFDWHDVHVEAIARSVELRQQRWRIKQRELELIATKNLLLPELNLVATYNVEGLGDDLIRTDRTTTGGLPGTSAFENLTQGRFTSNGIGLQYSMALGRRAELAAVRNQELQLLRERKRLEDQELEVSHALSDAIRDQQGFFVRAQTAFNRWVSAKEQVEAAKVGFDVGRSTLDLLLDAQRRQADAEVEFARIVTSYNLAISLVHFRKNSLLEYNGIHLAEGPWPGKAHFDTLRRARKRDASIYLNYGMTRPGVVSRGPNLQQTGQFGHLESVPTEATLEEAPGPRGVESVDPSEFESPEQPSPTVHRGTTLQIDSTADAIGGKFDWGDLGMKIDGTGTTSRTARANTAKANAVRQATHQHSEAAATHESNANSQTTEADRPASDRAGS